MRQSCGACPAPPDAAAGCASGMACNPLGQAESMLSKQADDGARTRDLRLGKPTLYQLSYVRKWLG